MIKPGTLLRVKNGDGLGARAVTEGELRWAGLDRSGTGVAYNAFGGKHFASDYAGYEPTTLTCEDFYNLKSCSVRLKLISDDRDKLAKLAHDAEPMLSIEQWRKSPIWDVFERVSINLDEWNVNETYHSSKPTQKTSITSGRYYIPLTCLTLSIIPDSLLYESEDSVNKIIDTESSTVNEDPAPHPARYALIGRGSPEDKVNPPQSPPIGKYCGGPCAVSKGICGNLTYGWGELNPSGYWEYPCDYCANKEYPVADQNLENSHDDLPSMEQMMTETIEDVRKRTCGICNKTLKTIQGRKDHQKNSKCGVAIAKAINQTNSNSPVLKPFEHVVPIKLESVALAEIEYKKDVMRMHVLQAVSQTVVRCLSLAAPTCIVVWRLLS